MKPKCTTWFFEIRNFFEIFSTRNACSYCHLLQLEFSPLSYTGRWHKILNKNQIRGFCTATYSSQLLGYLRFNSIVNKSYYRDLVCTFFFTKMSFDFFLNHMIWNFFDVCQITEKTFEHRLLNLLLYQAKSAVSFL